VTVDLYLIETAADTEAGFVYSLCELAPGVADIIASKARHPASPISAIVKLFPVSVGAE
jgi:hypothetical protein